MLHFVLPLSPLLLAVPVRAAAPPPGFVGDFDSTTTTPSPPATIAASTTTPFPDPTTTTTPTSTFQRISFSVPAIPTDAPAYRGLWTGDGPGVKEVREIHEINCWQPATVLSLVYSSPDWVKSLFYDLSYNSLASIKEPVADNVIIKVWNPNTMQLAPQLASIANQSKTENVPGGNWWPDAIAQAFLSLGRVTTVPGVFSNGTWFSMEGGFGAALTVLTGFKGVESTYDSSQLDQFFKDLQRAPETPIVVATKQVTWPVVPAIGAQHSYAVISANTTLITASRTGIGDGAGTGIGGGTENRTVTLRNPWGATETWPVWDLWNNTWALIHLENWEVLADELKKQEPLRKRRWTGEW